MPDTDFKDMCAVAYKARVMKLVDVLSEGLLTATSEGSKKEYKERFRHGLRAAREARDICIEVCSE
jgi:hypothetical protein